VFIEPTEGWTRLDRHEFHRLPINDRTVLPTATTAGSAVERGSNGSRVRGASPTLQLRIHQFMHLKVCSCIGKNVAGKCDSPLSIQTLNAEPSKLGVVLSHPSEQRVALADQFMSLQ
jgi:hypothetical protein